MTAPSDNTPNSIIADAMRDAGLLQEGASPNSEQLANNSRRLRDMIRLWQTQGLKLWLNVDTAVPLVAGTASYTLSPTGSVVMPTPMRVLEAYYQDSTSNRRPIFALSWNEYLHLSQVTQTGAITQYFVDKQQTQMRVFFWLVPDATAATGSVHLLLQTQVTGFTNLTETMNFPEEWRIALRWGLADEICTGQPVSIMERCRQRATQYRTMLEDWDVEDTDVRFAADVRASSDFI